MLILDEIQNGMGRCGTLFADEQYGIEPDIITLAKGLGGGVPIGAFLSKEHCAVFQPGDHGTTFGGNPLTCAVGYAVMKYTIENNVPANAKKMGVYLLDGMNKLKSKYPFITDVHGRGLLAAMYFNKDIGADVLTACIKTGLLINRVKPNAIRIMPALVITATEIDEGLLRLDKALGTVKGK